MRLRERAVEVMRDLPPGVHQTAPPSIRRYLRHSFGRYYAWEDGYDHHATPTLLPGQVNGPPGFVGIGAQKAGTTWWCALISRHPGVSDPPLIQKERHFFARFGAESFGPSDIADYHAWFPRSVGTISGEWTPDYYYYPWVPPLLAQAAPETKLLLMLRDPVERFRSGLAHLTRNGADHIGRTLAEALNRSLYAESLRRWHKFYPADQLLVLQYEACVADPATQLARSHEFLGLDPDFRPKNLRGKFNRTHEAKPKLPADALERFDDIIGPDLSDLVTLLPSLDFSLWPSASRLRI
ncbi:MAG: sulfotransferase family protein [Acidimicrobiales bacterium]